MKTKIYTRLISIIMTISVVISSICSIPFKSFSASLYIVSTSYSGNYDSESPMQFDVYSLNRNTSTFTGHIRIKRLTVRPQRYIQIGQRLQRLRQNKQ